MRLDKPMLTRIVACLAAGGLLASCGGSDDPVAAAAPVTTSLSGSVVKGPVANANVCAYKATSSGKGDQILCTTTNASGAYTLDLSYSGDVVIEASGGTYTDEATSSTKSLSDPMQVVLNANGGTAVGVITPLTAAAYSVSKGLGGGVSSANFTTAANTVATQFQLSGVNLATTLPAVTGTLNDYGRMLRAVSQYMATNNVSLANFAAFNTPQALQANFGAAYALINGNTLTFTFPGGSVSVTPGDNSGNGGGGSESCGITVSGSGSVTTGGMTVPFTLPATKVCVTGVPANACAAGNNTLQNIAAGGATPQGNYSISYSYSYAAGDCAGAILTYSYTGS